MQRDDAACQQAIAYAAESSGRDFLGKGLRLREAPDRFDEIAIWLGIADDKATKRRNDVERIKVVERVEPRHVDGREFETDETASGPQHAKKFAERDIDLRHVADAKRNGHRIVSAVREGQALGIAHRETHPVESEVMGALAPDREHVEIDVADRDLSRSEEH